MNLVGVFSTMWDSIFVLHSFKSSSGSADADDDDAFSRVGKLRGKERVGVRGEEENVWESGATLSSFLISRVNFQRRQHKRREEKTTTTRSTAAAASIDGWQDARTEETSILSATA